MTATPTGIPSDFTKLRIFAWIVLALGVLFFQLAGKIAAGPLTHHMLIHIALMNLLAPGVVIISLPYIRNFLPDFGPMIWPAALIQIFLFLFWHAPPGMTEGPATIIMHINLTAAALWFWIEVLTWRRARSWMAVAALAVTGKIICLVAALYVFAPRTLYGDAVPDALDDQHTAGLIMLAACPLAYLGAALLITIEALNSHFNRPPRILDDAA